MCFSSQPSNPVETPAYKPDDIDKNIQVSSKEEDPVDRQSDQMPGTSDKFLKM